MINETTIKVINVYTPILMSANISDTTELPIDNVSISLSMDNPARASCVITMFEDLDISSTTSLNINYGGDTLGFYYVERSDYIYGRLSLSLFSNLQILDFYPVINDNSDDGCFTFRKGDKIVDAFNSMLRALGWTFYIEFHSDMNFEIPSDKKYGNGETLYSILKDISDFAGAVIIDDIFNGKIRVLPPSKGNSVSIDEDLIISKTISKTNEYLYSQVFIRDTDGGLKRPVKYYSYKPFPYNRRAIFYTYRGLLTDKNKAGEIAESIMKAIEIGDVVETYEIAGVHRVIPTDKVFGGVVLEVNIDISSGENPSAITTIRVAK